MIEIDLGLGVSTVGYESIDRKTVHITLYKNKCKKRIGTDMLGKDLDYGVETTIIIHGKKGLITLRDALDSAEMYFDMMGSK